MSAHDRWQVFRGESVEPNNLVFSVKRSSIIQLKTKLHVFLANNTTENVCDYKIEGSWSERSCLIYAGDSSTVVAQVSFFFFFLQLIVLIDKITFELTAYVIK